jgi:phosphoribosyl 1,2-cyclic phosphate phosphodiesterase
MHIDLDFEQLTAELPEGVEPAYDGLTIQHELSDLID